MRMKSRNSLNAHLRPYQVAQIEEEIGEEHFFFKVKKRKNLHIFPPNSSRKLNYLYMLCNFGLPIDWSNKEQFFASSEPRHSVPQIWA